MSKLQNVFETPKNITIKSSLCFDENASEVLCLYYNMQVGKTCIFQGVNASGKTHMACCEKYKPYILKYKALISKYMPYIFDEK
ncbi:MAG: hypothetical protein DBY24_09565 [Prevotellaceae bacterium]|nr:MAG: hypothetical protein DBY24_09565 [Prevotellaceae bacterium]